MANILSNKISPVTHRESKPIDQTLIHLCSNLNFAEVKKKINYLFATYVHPIIISALPKNILLNAHLRDVKSWRASIYQHVTTKNDNTYK